MSEPVRIGDATLYLGDCLEILPTLGPVDAVVTDPPYGMEWDTDTTRFSGGMQKVSRGKDWGESITGDDKPFDPTPWIQFERVVLWGANHYADRLPRGTTLVWVKRNDDAFGSFLSDGEMAWMKSGYGLYCFRDVPNISDRGAHPTQKPVPLMAWCIEKVKAPAGCIILDPFMGSGTTGVACARLDRKFIGIEIEPRYFDIACKRIEREYAQLKLFPPEPKRETVQMELDDVHAALRKEG